VWRPHARGTLHGLAAGHDRAHVARAVLEGLAFAARDVVVLEATRCGNGASGRNGGFLMSSLTHGIANGLTRFPDEMDRLERLGFENFDALARDLEQLGIDAEYEPTGDLLLALEPHELDDLEADAELARRFGHRADVLDAEQTRAQVNSPLFLGSLWTHTGSALVHPGKLGDGLRAAYELAGSMWANVAVTQAFLTLSEVLGHLDLLLRDGLVRELEDDGISVFEALEEPGPDENPVTHLFGFTVGCPAVIDPARGVAALPSITRWSSRSKKTYDHLQRLNVHIRDSPLSTRRVRRYPIVGSPTRMSVRMETPLP